MTLNYFRVVAAAVAAAIADLAYGSLVYGTLLQRDMAIFGGMFRSVAQVNALYPFVAIVLLGSGLAAAVIFAKGFASGRRVQDGLLFGIVMGVFAVCYVTIGNYVVLEIPKRLTVELAAAQFVEWLVVGVVIAIVYRPTVRSLP